MLLLYSLIANEIDRDVRHLVIWMDNCGPQNKNWTLYPTLVQAVNDNTNTLKTITLKYFEAGHTFMSADSFHHQVEKEAKSQGYLYDFKDFCQVCRQSWEVDGYEVKRFPTLEK